jgi:hypothetical protein
VVVSVVAEYITKYSRLLRNESSLPVIWNQPFEVGMRSNPGESITLRKYLGEGGHVFIDRDRQAALGDNFNNLSGPLSFPNKNNANAQVLSSLWRTYFAFSRSLGDIMYQFSVKRVRIPALNLAIALLATFLGRFPKTLASLGFLRIS